MAGALRFIIVPKVVHPWFEENHRNALIPDAADRRHMAYCVNRIYSDATRAASGSFFQDCALLRNNNIILTDEKGVLN